jgi:hypothetical protein
LWNRMRKSGRGQNIPKIKGGSGAKVIV